MKNYTLNWLIEKFESEEKIKYLFFWGSQKPTNGQVTAACFSQWYVAPFVVDTVTYPTAEHWMMAQKALLFNDQESYHKIIMSHTPGEAKELGRAIQNFDQEIWNQHRFAIVVEGNIHKFTQHEALQHFLLGTQERILVEASPIDSIWGIGLTAESEEAQNPKLWNGLNLLGFALMEVRALLNLHKH